jgi:hypothetical protein
MQGQSHEKLILKAYPKAQKSQTTLELGHDQIAVEHGSRRSMNLCSLQVGEGYLQSSDLFSLHEYLELS